ncbi:MAG TPA: exodeoxyribonuclease VII large subunit [Gammaproteobacteria bacterium]|nr:exodeoxyribonuclease VII large subunit [Gammaproteobacteria bacterium]
MASLPDSPPARQIYSVSSLNRAARGLLEGGLPLLWVEGELSNLSRPASGHLYFSLKDANAQVRCALFRNRAGLLRFAPKDGLHVLLRARVSLYEARGDFQLIVEHMEEAGHGALQRAFEELKKKLAAEGLFDSAHKQPLPVVPRVIGVVSSPSGAAIRDILSVIRRRYPVARVILYPVPVQGEGAAGKIAAMLHTASERAECDVLILSRGGGSLEDLWAFNEEALARAIHTCALPVVSGIGHEIDFTIADFVADVRAPTPTGAAELVTPDSGEWLRLLVDIRTRITQAQARTITVRKQRLAWCIERLEQLHPARLLRDRAQRLDELEARLGNGMRLLLHTRRHRGNELQTRLQRHNPASRLMNLRGTLDSLRQRLGFAARQQLGGLQARLGLAIHSLHTVSPLATLERGYAIVSDAGSGRVLTSVTQVRENQTVRTQLADGGFLAHIGKLDSKEKK